MKRLIFAGLVVLGLLIAIDEAYHRGRKVGFSEGLLYGEKILVATSGIDAGQMFSGKDGSYTWGRRMKKNPAQGGK